MYTAISIFILVTSLLIFQLLFTHFSQTQDTEFESGKTTVVIRDSQAVSVFNFNIFSSLKKASCTIVSKEAFLRYKHNNSSLKTEQGSYLVNSYA